VNGPNRHYCRPLFFPKRKQSLPPQTARKGYGVLLSESTVLRGERHLRCWAASQPSSQSFPRRSPVPR